MAKSVLTAFLLFWTFAYAESPADGLQKEFRTPPDESRPWVYWVWMDGNLSRDGITADLEAMKRAGIGGVIIGGTPNHVSGSILESSKTSPAYVSTVMTWA
jgi:(4-O-methyl)-D-glucuronate---lignin esterase